MILEWIVEVSSARYGENHSTIAALPVPLSDDASVCDLKNQFYVPCTYYMQHLIMAFLLSSDGSKVPTETDTIILYHSYNTISSQNF